MVVVGVIRKKIMYKKTPGERLLMGKKKKQVEKHYFRQVAVHILAAK